jgi:20S proteasome alpha/beta subunit
VIEQLPRISRYVQHGWGASSIVKQRHHQRTASGYEVAWKNGGADQYSIWNTDSGGNYTSHAVGIVSGGDFTLQSLEPSFHQDLNGDGAWLLLL